MFALNTASLAASPTGYTGIITVSAPGAVDAPQTITVTVQTVRMGPSSVNVYLPPDGYSQIPYSTADDTFKSTVSTQDGANWLSLELAMPAEVTLCGSPWPMGANCTTSYIVIVPQPTNTPGNTYTGSIVISNSSYPPDDGTIPVTMHVTTLPIAQPLPTAISQQLAAGASVGYRSVTFYNSGLGTLAISGVTASGPGIAATGSGNTAQVALDPTGLSPGTYAGSVSIVSNAANSPTTIPVSFQVVPSGPPTIFYRGVVDDATFGEGGVRGVAPGDIVALFGQQLSFAPPAVGPIPPLAMQLGGASVFVNGEQAPLYYSSYGQINFQMPTDTPAGTALVQVETNGQMGNAVSVNVAARAPELLPLYGMGGYGAIVDASQGDGYDVLPMPSTFAVPGFITQPAKPGDILTIYAIGLGPTNPAVAAGQPAPDGIEAPLARSTVTPAVSFSNFSSGTGLSATPSYAGLSPHFAGLYQINAAIPADCPTGTVYVWLTFPDSGSNVVEIEVQ
jgi:uncharacterized protein (TIGR03437 family)